MRKAFTLIEILIVVILAAIVIPMFTDATDQARQAKIDTDLSSLHSQLELYRAQCGIYPPNGLSDLTTQVAAGVDVDGDGDASNDFYGPWIKEVPLQPDGTAYNYNSTDGTVTAGAAAS